MNPFGQTESTENEELEHDDLPITETEDEADAQHDEPLPVQAMAPSDKKEELKSVNNPQGLNRPSAPNKQELEMQMRKNIMESNARASISDNSSVTKKKIAYFRGYDPSTHEALYAWEGKSLTAKQVPKGIELEAIKLPPKQPVV